MVGVQVAVVEYQYHQARVFPFFPVFGYCNDAIVAEHLHSAIANQCYGHPVLVGKLSGNSIGYARGTW